MLRSLIFLTFFASCLAIVHPKEVGPLMHHYDADIPDYDPCTSEEPEVIEHTRDVPADEVIEVPYAKYAAKKRKPQNEFKLSMDFHPPIQPLYPPKLEDATKDNSNYDLEYDEEEEEEEGEEEEEEEEEPDSPPDQSDGMARLPSRYRLVRYRPRPRRIRLVRKRKRPSHVIFLKMPKPPRRPYHGYLPSASSKRRRVVCDDTKRHPDNRKCKSSPLEVVAAWSFLSFASEEGKKPRILENAVFTGISKWGERLFISIPRFKHGVPATLTWMPTKPRKKYLRPFPDWTWQRGHISNCTGLVSVFRTRVDACGRLWVLDSGSIDSEQICPPRLLTFNLRTHELLKSFSFPSRVLRSPSLLTFFTFDMENHPRNCDDMMIYVSDSIGNGIIAFDVQTHKVWRFEHETFAMKPEFSTFNIAGETSSTDDGIIGMAVGTVNSNRVLFYHAFAGLTIFAIPTSSLRVPGSRLPVMTVLDKTSPGVALASDMRGLVYFSPLSETALMAFEANTGQERVLMRDEARLQFVSDITVDSQGDLWLISNRYQSFQLHSYDPEDMNFRIMRLPGKLPMFRVNNTDFSDFEDY